MIRLPDLLPMRPHLREMVWGGRRLHELYRKRLPADRPIGESFELSGYPGRESVVASGPLEGRDLGALLAEYREELVGRRVWSDAEGRFPLLVKLLDARQDLSIQVHPDDRHAREQGLPDRGKTEAWFVLHAEGGRVACGLRPGVDRERFEAGIRQGRVMELVQFHPVQAGDVVFLPAGVVHALCSGVVVYEVQQSSDLTFRVHDYGRLGLDGRPRELHLDQALAVIDFAGEAVAPRSWREYPGAARGEAVLVECPYFRLVFHAPGAEGRGHAAQESFQGVTVVDGQARLSAGREECRVRAGDTVLIPASRGFGVEPAASGSCTYLVATASA
ncbi:MAG: type I phosphomannose isomerase catalytic subunit [Candidatus Latescibacterota bacterium]|jgi:mannose-6-phosphate isomerase